MPKLFSNEPQKTLEELKQSPQFAFDCLQALVARLLERGELSRYNKPDYIIKRYQFDINK